jgi:hypothetical protein
MSSKREFESWEVTRIGKTWGTGRTVMIVYGRINTGEEKKEKNRVTFHTASAMLGLIA